MRINKAHHNSNGRKALVVGIIILGLIIIGAGSAYLLMNGRSYNNDSASPDTNSSSHNDSSSINDGPSTDEQIHGGATIKDESTGKTESDSSSTGDVRVTVAATKQTSSSIKIQTTISKVTNKGACTLTIKSGSAMHSYSSGVQALTSYSTCKGFTIDSLKSGSWIIEVRYSDDSQSGSATTSITL